MKKKLYLILSAVTVFICTFAILSFPQGKADGNDTHGNTLQHVYDESVNIPEPPENIGRVPAHIRWEPMLGSYILKSAKYDPETKSFIVREEGLLSPADPNAENPRINDWMAKNKQPWNRFFSRLIAYETKRETVLTDSSRYDPGEDEGVTKGIIPLGIPYLHDMLDMVMNQKLFDIPLTYSIGQITGTDCQPKGMNYDGYEQTHDQWRGNMKDLLGGVETAVKNGDDLSKYGLFVLPYLDQLDDARRQKFQNEYAALLKKGGGDSGNLSDPQWTAHHTALVKQIRKCIDDFR